MVDQETPCISLLDYQSSLRDKIASFEKVSHLRIESLQYLVAADSVQPTDQHRLSIQFLQF